MRSFCRFLFFSTMSVWNHFEWRDWNRAFDTLVSSICAERENMAFTPESLAMSGVCRPVSQTWQLFAVWLRGMKRAGLRTPKREENNSSTIQFLLSNATIGFKTSLFLFLTYTEIQIILCYYPSYTWIILYGSHMMSWIVLLFNVQLRPFQASGASNEQKLSWQIVSHGVNIRQRQYVENPKKSSLGSSQPAWLWCVTRTQTSAKHYVFSLSIL